MGPGADALVPLGLGATDQLAGAGNLVDEHEPVLQRRLACASLSIEVPPPACERSQGVADGVS